MKAKTRIAVLLLLFSIPFVGCSSTNGSVKELRAENTNLEEKLVQKENEIDGLQSRVDNLKQTNRSLSRSLQDMQNRMDQMENAPAGSKEVDIQIPEALKDRVEKITINGRSGLRLSNHVLFSPGSAQLTDEGKKAIEQIVPVLKQFEGQSRIRVEGHTDNVPIQESKPKFPTNWHLSASRAVTVGRHLIQQGISKDSLEVVGHADTVPIASNDEASGRKKNRRVEITIVPLK